LFFLPSPFFFPLIFCGFCFVVLEAVRIQSSALLCASLYLLIWLQGQEGRESFGGYGFGKREFSLSRDSIVGMFAVASTRIDSL
jgi:hypothetical protein